MVDNPEMPRFVSLGLRPVLGAMAAALVLFLAGVGFGPLNGFMDRWAGLAIEIGAAVGIWLRVAFVRDERLAWALLAAAISAWALGDLFWRVAYFDAANPPAFTLADALWMAFYPLAYAGIALLLRNRSRDVQTAVWLDGLIAALAMAALASAVVLRAVLDQPDVSSLGMTVNYTYVVADAVLLGLVLVAFAASGWRPDQAWAWLGAALALFAISDSVYLRQSALGSYSGGGPLDAGWSLALLLVCVAAWHTAPARQDHRPVESWRSIGLPIAFGFLALAIEVYDHFTRVTVLALLFASACLVAVFARLAITFAQYLRMLRASREQARTDPLTGLANRRQLMTDLGEALDARATGEDWLLLLLDLDGFKAYNDTLGHGAGDALLERLGRGLERAVAPWGRAYRMGGDEFCALLRPAGAAPAKLARLAAGAFAEPAAPLPISSSAGWALVPAEAADPSSALRLADQRMYAQKDGHRPADRRSGPRATAGSDRPVVTSRR